MSLTGGKRKVNKSLKAWVAFVKKVQREEKLSYKEAIHRAKVRKDKGEKWMKGGDGDAEVEEDISMEMDETIPTETMSGEDEGMDEQMGGRRRRTRRRGRSMRRGRTMRRRRGSRRR
jgi:hypothetical protein